MSGNIAGTPGCTITGPVGKITVANGVIAAARHVHLSAEQAALYGVKDGDVVSIKTPPPRKGIIGNIVVRIGKDFDMEVHLDTDEANGSGLLCGTILEAYDLGGKGAAQQVQDKAALNAALELITENDINNVFARGEKFIYYTAKGFVSPAARDRAKEKGITLCKLQG
jgi:hypothetical protein